jgi:hypothetical protein
VAAGLYLHEAGRPASAVRVWPVPAGIAPGAIQEARNYILELRDAAGADAANLYIDDVLVEALRSPTPDVARWRWSPGFYAGAVEARIDFGTGRESRFEIVTDPDLRKLTRDDFDTMVREILEDTHALFALSGFRTGIARGDGKEVPPIARLEFLRSRLEALEHAVREIDRRPIRKLETRTVPVPHYRARGVTGLEILRSYRSGRVLRENPPGRLPPARGGTLPE